MAGDPAKDYIIVLKMYKVYLKLKIDVIFEIQEIVDKKESVKIIFNRKFTDLLYKNDKITVLHLLIAI